MFLEISQNSQENTCAKVFLIIKKKILAHVFSCEFCEISQKTFSYKTPPVAASWLKRPLTIVAKLFILDNSMGLGYASGINTL